MTDNNQDSNSIDEEKQMSQEERKAQRHKQRQQKVKEAVDAKIAAAQEEKGILLVLTGNGKGKSTSGFGTIARSVGHGKKSAVVQFIKGNWECGERTLLEGAGVEFHVMGTGFTWNTQDREVDIAAAKIVWEQAKVFLKDPDIHVVLLDELTYMLSYDYLPKDEILDALKNRPREQSVVVTGRRASAELIEMADTVSDIQDTKHAFRAGIKIRKGVDW